MRKSLHDWMLKRAALAAALLVATGLASAATTVNLIAQRATAVLPDGNSVPMWQFCGAAGTNAAGTASAGTTIGGACAASTTTPVPWAPGPTIVVPVGDVLTVNLTNKLPVATSFTIVGQIGGSDSGNPTRAASPAHPGQTITTWPANTTATFTPPAQGTRARAFGLEAAAGGGTQTYTWGSTLPLQAGTYLYQTGTHPSLQQPMGLYGVLIVTTAPVASSSTATPPVTTVTTAGAAYPSVTPPLQVGGTTTASTTLPPGNNAYGVPYAGVPYDADATFLLSEIDPVQNAAVDAAAMAGTSETLVSSDPSCAAAQHGGTVACYPAAVNYRPTYFLVNGSPFDSTNPAATTAVVADGARTGNVLLRFANAGSRLHVPAINGLQLTVLSEDGNLAPGNPKVQSEVNLPPGRTVDALINPALGTGTTISGGVAASTGASAVPAYTDQVYAVYDRALSLAGNNVAGAGMHGFLAVAPAGTTGATAVNTFLGSATGGVKALSASAANYTFNLAPNVLSSFTASVGTNSIGINLVATGTAPTKGTLSWNGTSFTYTPTTAPIASGDSFTYCSAGSTTLCGTVTLNVVAETATITVPATAPVFNATLSTLYRAVTRGAGVLAGYSASDGYPLNAALAGTNTCGAVVLNADGSFSATPTARTGGACTFQFTATDPRTKSSVTGSATVNFPAPSNYKLSVVDALNGATGAVPPITDYMWQIEEDRTFFNATPGVTPPMINGVPTPTLAVSFHQSFMPVVAQGCTGPLSCGDGLGGQKIQGVATGAAVYTTPADVALDPTKHYYLSILPGDAGNPFINGYLSDPTINNTCLYQAGTGAAPTNCGHTMGGGSIAPGQLASTITVEPNPLKPAALSIYIFEDNSPTNNDYDANETGLGGFEIIVNDVAGRSGDPVGQITYDAFNMPLTNKLLGVTGCPNETPAGTAAAQQTNLVGVVYTCPDGNRQISAASVSADGSTINVTTAVPHQFGSSVQGAGPTIDISGLAVATLNGSFTITVTGANTFSFANPGGVAAGTKIQVWPSSKARDATTYQLAGQALINNIMPGRFDVLAHPGAAREGSGETWYQTSTLEGTPGQDAFTKAGEPNYFQEFGPPGFHTFIGWLNPAHIADQNAIALAQAAAANIPGQTGTVTISGRVTSLHMSRTTMETLWDSASNAAIAQSNCFVAINQNGETGNDVGFTACNPDGTFTLPPVPQGQQYELVIWDQWLDQIIAFQNINPNQVSSASPTMTLSMGDIPVFSWFTRVEAKLCYDTNNNGVCDAGEPGLSQLPVLIHFRDGSISNVLTTDGNGNAVFNELFPLFNWYVIESDNVRYASTGVNVTVDAGGQPDCVTTNTTTGQGTLGAACANSPTAGVLNSSYVWTDPTSGASYGGVPPGMKTASTTNPNSTNRIDPGTNLYNGAYEGLQTFINQTQIINWARRNFNVGENGGIQGMVVYSSTRGFDDPSLQVQNLWEPGIARVTVNLYREQANPDGTTGYVLVNSTLSSSWDDWANLVQGSDGNNYVLAPDNKLYVPGTWAPAPSGVTTNFTQVNMRCPGQDPNDPYVKYSIGTAQQFKCYDGFHMWNQVQPAVFDGLYLFTTGYAHGMSAAGTPLVPGEVPTVLPPATYVVEAVPPAGYEIVKEEDKNILIGDQFVAPAAQQFGALSNIFILPDQAALSAMYNPANPGTYNATTNPGGATSNNATQRLGFTEPNQLYPRCVGSLHQVPDFMSLFPISGQVAPFAGAMKPLCDRKEVVLNDQATGVANFFLFTTTPRASHFTGLMLDDMAAEINAAAPDFGEKFAAAYAPVSLRDANGIEVGRVYTDQWGTYNGLMYSTWQVNVPNPAGYSPNMMVTCMNDPGPIPGPSGKMITDPLYNPQYSNFCYTNPFMPGMTVYLDTPIVPVSAFAAGYNPPDCALPSATPAIARVDGDGIGPWVGAGPSSIASVKMLTAGSGYTHLPVGRVSGGGSNAVVVAQDLTVVAARVTNATAGTGQRPAPANSGYSAANPPLVTITGPGGTGASATAVVNAAGTVTGITNIVGGSGFIVPATITIAPPPGVQALATLALPAAGGAAASATVTLGTAGSGYCSAPEVRISGGTHAGANRSNWRATATVSNGSVSGIALTGTTVYSSAPLLTIGAPNCVRATAVATMGVNSAVVTAAGSGYAAPTVTFPTPDGGTAATATLALGTSAGVITITALGDVTIPNPNYQGPSATTSPWNTKTLSRHYGFGATQGTGSVTLGGKPLAVTSWNDSTIVANVGSATTGELSITSGNGLKSVDAVTVNVGETKTPVVVEPVANAASSAGNAHPIQDAIDAARPGDLIVVDAGSYPELVVMWKPVRLQGVGAASTVINAAKYPTQKLQNWRPRINALFGVDTVLGNQVGNSQVDPLPNQEITGGIVLLEPSVLATEEGAGITVLGKNPASVGADGRVNAVCPLGITRETRLSSVLTSSAPDQVLFPPTNNTVNIKNSNTLMSDSNFDCAPSRIDGLAVTGGDSGGGIYVNGWADNLEIANNRVYGNAGSYNGGIRVGVPYLEALTYTPTADDGTVFGYDKNVHIHHNLVTNNGTVEANPGTVNAANSTGAGGGLSICTGTDNYLVNDNFICGNFSQGDGGGIGQTGVSNNGLITENTIIFNQSYQQTAQVNGGGIVIEGELGAVGGLSLGTGNVTIDRNVIRGNFAEGGHGGGIRLQQVNGSDVGTNPATPSAWYTVTITNNMITNNVAAWGGAGISAADALAVNVSNNTIAYNDSMGMAGNMIGTNPLARTAPLSKTTGYPAPAGVSVDRTTSALLTGLSPALQAAGQYANVTLYNDIVYDNRSFYFAITSAAALTPGANGNVTVTPTNTLCPSNTVGDAYALNCTPLAAQTTIGACDTTNARYWDVGTTDDASATPGSNALKAQLNPTYSVLTSATGYAGAGNSSTDPGFTHAYCNGARANPAFIYEPGQPFLDPSTQNLTAGATLDEAGNYVDVRFGPLYLYDPTTATSTTPGTVIGDFHLAGPTGGAYDVGGSIATGPATLALDIDGNQRPRSGGTGSGLGSGVDIGSAQVAAAGQAGISLSTGTLALGNVQTGQFGTATVTISNTALAGSGAPNLVISGVTVAPATAFMAASTNCPAGGIAAGATCTLTVTFAPTGNFAAATAETATISVASNGANGTQTVTATGTAYPPALSLNPAPTVAFGTVPDGSTTANATVTVSNTGVGPWYPTAIVTGSGYTRLAGTAGGTCSALAAVAAPGSCTVVLNFDPTAAGPLSGSLSVSANAYLGAARVVLEQSVAASDSLTGTGEVPSISISPAGSSHAFGNVQTGQASSTTWTISNATGAAGFAFPLAIAAGNGATQAQFSDTSTCGATLAVGASCTITVRFAPSSAGNKNGSFTISSGALNLQTLTVTGTGVNPTATLAPAAGSAANFGTWLVGAASTAQTFTYSNGGVGPLTIAAANGVTLTAGSGFSIASTTCTPNLVLAAGANCSVSVNFATTGAGTKGATLSVNDAAGGAGTTTLALSGNVVTTPFTLASAGFTGNSAAGSDTITVSNQLSTAAARTAGFGIAKVGTAGNTVLTLSGAGSCSAGGTVAAGQTCTVVVNSRNANAPGSRTTSTYTVTVTPGVGAAATINVGNN